MRRPTHGEMLVPCSCAAVSGSRPLGSQGALQRLRPFPPQQWRSGRTLPWGLSQQRWRTRSRACPARH
ncbi:hypothetical protein ACFPRL_35990 [Pseudoclavibacter helvolus]